MDKSIHISQMAHIIEEVLKNGASFEFTPRGISMRPSVVDGDVAYIKKPSFPLKKYDIVLYRRNDHTVVLHRVVGRIGKSYIMAGDAQSYIEYPIDETDIIGVVSGVSRGGKAVKCLRSNAFVYLFFRDIRLWYKKARLYASVFRKKFIKRGKTR